MNVDWFRRTKKSIIEKSSFSQTHDHFRWFTMRQVKIKCNHRFQKKDFRFVKIRFVVSFTKIRFVVSWFFSRKFSFRWFENALCKFFIQFTKIRFVVSWFFFKKISHFDDFILFIRVSRRAIYSKQKVWRMSINFAKFKTKKRCVVNNELSSLQLIKRFRVENVRSSRIDNDFVFFYSLIVATNVKFTLFVTMKIKYNVKNRVWLEK